MSKRSRRRSDLLILAAVAVAVGGAVALFVAAGLLRESDRGRHGLRSTYSADRSGTLGFCRLARGLGAPLGRNTRPLLGKRLGEVGGLFLIDPADDPPFSDGERRALRQWVRRGGVLVCTADVVEEIDLNASGGTSFADPRTEAGTATNVPDDRRDLPLARDVRRLHFAGGWTGSLDGGGSGQAGRSRPLLADETGPRVLAMPFGEGHVVLLADSSFLANRWLGLADNAVAAMNLVEWTVAHAGHRPLVYDEHHLGQGRYDSSLQLMGRAVFGTSPGWAVLVLLAAGTMGLVYKGRRFGTRRRPPAARRRRSKMEFVRAVGATYRRAGATRTTLETVFQWFLAAGARRVGLPPETGLEPLANRLAARTSVPVDSFLETFLDCRDALDQDAPIPPRRLNQLIGALAELETEILNGRQAGQ